jgi:hypothetical protein
MFDSTVVRAHVSAAGAIGGKKSKRSGAGVTARNFRSIVSFVAGLCLLKFVHTA